MRLLLLTCIAVESCLSSSPVILHNTARRSDMFEKDFSFFRSLWSDSIIDRYFEDIKRGVLKSDDYSHVVPGNLSPKETTDKESTSMPLIPPRPHLPWILPTPEPEKGNSDPKIGNANSSPS